MATKSLIAKMVEKALVEALGGNTKGKSASSKFEYEVIKGVSYEIAWQSAKTGELVTKTFPAIRFKSGSEGVLTREGKVPRALWGNHKRIQ
jgi:hypothetical protein